MAVCRVRRSRPGRYKEGQRHLPSSMVRCTREVSQMYFSAVSNQKKGNKFSGIFIKESVVIMPLQEPWLPRHSGMGSIAQVLCKKQKISSESAMDARCMPTRFICRLQHSRLFPSHGHLLCGVWTWWEHSSQLGVTSVSYTHLRAHE